MRRKPQLTYVTGVVLQCIARGYRYGFDIMDTSGLPDGTVYPALRRLEAAGYLEASWEDVEVARADGRPARRYYDLTTEGERALGSARERFPALGTGFPPAALEPGEAGA